jgi:hypothetical protein
LRAGRTQHGCGLPPWALVGRRNCSKGPADAPSQICSTYVTYPIASNAIEHCSGLAGIDGLKALRERAVDLGEFIVGFRSSSALRQKPRTPCTASQEKCARMLGLRALHGAPEAAFRILSVTDCQGKIALEQVQTGVGPVLTIALGDCPGLGESDDRVVKPLRSAVKVSKNPQIVRQAQLSPAGGISPAGRPDVVVSMIGLSPAVGFSVVGSITGRVISSKGVFYCFHWAPG